MSDFLNVAITVVVITALCSAIATPLILFYLADEFDKRIDRVEREIANLDFDLNGPDGPDDGEPDVHHDNVVAIGKRAA